LQAVFEDATMKVLNHVQRATGQTRLCFAGGCAMNSVANGEIRARTAFTDVFVQPAAGDNGTALGAAFDVWHRRSKAPRDFVMEHGYWGPESSDAEIAAVLDAAAQQIAAAGCTRRVLCGADAITSWTARQLADGRVV